MAAAVFTNQRPTRVVFGDLNHRFNIVFIFVLKTTPDLTTLMWNRLPMLFH